MHFHVCRLLWDTISKYLAGLHGARTIRSQRKRRGLSALSLITFVRIFMAEYSQENMRTRYPARWIRAGIRRTRPIWAWQTRSVSTESSSPRTLHTEA